MRQRPFKTKGVMRLRLKVVQTGYALGTSLLLTSIFYLFASNWQSFDRYSKIRLSIGLLILFYLLHFILRKVLKQQHFLGNWLLVAEGIVFGVTLALIGQIYNSHADSYLLYLIWFIPMILLAIFTKYHPFYLLSFILAHLSIFMFMTPSSYFPEWNPVAFFWMYIGIMLLNAILFLFCYRKMLTSKTIYYVSYLMFFSIFFIVTITEDLPLFYLNNLIYIAILIWMIYYWTKIDKQHALLVITSIYAAIY